MKYFNIALLSDHLDMDKFRKVLEKSIGSEDGLKKEHLKLNDTDIVKKYLEVYDDLSSLADVLTSKGAEYYLDLCENHFGNENRDNTKKGKIQIGLKLEHTSEYDE